jgi:hypothetical protein
MANTFRIGKAGPTIFQGSGSPDNNNGNNGDLYVQIGASPSLYIKKTYGWFSSSDPSFGFVPQSVTETGITLNNTTTYAAMNVGSTCTVQLMPRTSGQTVIIMDESGRAASNVITVIPQDGDTINNETSWNIDLNFGSLTVLGGVNGWFITSAITSAPFNEIRL